MKRKTIIALTLVLTGFSSAAQVDMKPQQPAQTGTGNTEVYPIADEAPEFPGGAEALYKFLADNIVYPEITRKKKQIEGKCYLKLIVSAEGHIGTVYVMRGVPDCPECDKEAVRVVKTMPAWKPGKVKGEAAATYVMLPVTFKRYRDR